MTSSRQRGDGMDIPRSIPSVPAAQLVGHVGPINAVQFTADGKYCLTAGYDRSVRLWNPTRLDPSYSRDGRSDESVPHALPIQTYTDGHSHPVSAVAVDPGSTTLLSASDRVLVVTDVVSRRVKRRFHGHAARINAVSCAAGAEAFLSASYDGTVRVWDGRSRSADPVQVLDEARDSVSAVEAAQGDGSADIVTASVDGVLRTYDLRKGQIRCDDVGDAITGMAMTHDGQCIAVTCLDGTVRLLERSTGELLQTYTGRHIAGKYGLGCDFTADDSFVVSGSEDGAVVLYDLIKGSVAQTLVGHSKPTCSIAAHPKRDWKSVVISASYDGGVLVWANEADTYRWS